MVQATQEHGLEESGQKNRFQPVLLSIGANQASDFGAPSETIRQAIGMLADVGIDVTSSSRFYHSPAFPPGSGPDFVNGALVAKSRLTPHDILAVLNKIESHFGRVRDTRWGPRTLDVDLIGVGQKVLPDPVIYRYWRDLGFEDQQTQAPNQLILPHPRLQERAFVLIPLADVAPDWQHPVSGVTVREMLKALPDSETKAIIPI